MIPSSNFLQQLSINFSQPLLFTLCAIFVVVLFTRRKIKKESSQLPPGPSGLPLIGNLASLDPELHSYFAKLAQTYGPIMKLRLGQKLGIIVTSPSLARQVLRDQDVTFANHDVPTVARALSYGGRDIVWTPYGSEWRMLRKVCVLKMLSNTTLDSVYGLRRREVRETVSYLYSQAGTTVNVGEQIFLTILNVVTNMLWGGTVEGEERASVGRDFRHVISEITELLGKPNISDFFPALDRFDLQGTVKKMKGLASQFDGIFNMLIEKHLATDRKGESKGDNNAKECKDFLQFLFKVKAEEDAKPPLNMDHIKALLMDMVVGGTDTSSNAIEFAMAEIIKKPKVMLKAQQELDEVIGQNSIVEEFHINKLPYLQAVMKEVLRLHPVLPLLVPHCPSETCTVGGYTVPKGSRIFVNVWAIHRDPSIWENPLEFVPERFLNDQWDYSGSDFNYFPFGSGRRMCAGLAMAERMFMYSLATLLHSFDWKLPEGERLEITEKFGIVVKLKTPLVAIPVPRLSDPTLYQ